MTKYVRMSCDSDWLVRVGAHISAHVLSPAIVIERSRGLVMISLCSSVLRGNRIDLGP